jgi:hypothetical protein
LSAAIREFLLSNRETGVHFRPDLLNGLAERIKYSKCENFWGGWEL